MNKSYKNTFDPNLKKALSETILRDLPEDYSSPYILEIINALIGSLSRGDIYLDLDEKESIPLEIKSKGWPTKHSKALEQSGLLSTENGPLVITDNLLAFKRWHKEMEELIYYLEEKSKNNINSLTGSSLKDQQNFQLHLNNDQKKAIEKVLFQKLILISGGPGTGKTKTIAQMLIQLFINKPNIKVGLAAPTGKAARRLRESLHASLDNVNENIMEKLLKVQCKTLHKWLKAKEGKFLVNKSHPLQLDLLVVDEMSMVDINLMKSLTNALQKRTQLVLVGDPDQLPPIGSGAIWNHLHTKKMLTRFKDERIELRKVYRNRGQIALLAKSLQSKGLDSFWEDLNRIPSDSNVDLHKERKSIIPPFIINELHKHQKNLQTLSKNLVINKYYMNINSEGEEEEAFKDLSTKIFCCLEELIVLCPRKYGYWSVDHINKTMLENHFENDISTWPEGVPVICGANQPEIGLSNGDIGLTVGNEGSRYLLFRVMSEDQKLKSRLIEPSRIKQLNAAFAITIHKAQGSESARVILMWPNSTYDHLSLKKEVLQLDKKFEKSLLYTAITRAKKRLDIIKEDLSKE